MVYVEPGPLVMDTKVAHEVLRAVHRLFLLHTDNITLSVSANALQILVMPRADERIELPNGEMVYSLQGNKFEILGRPDVV